MTANHSAALMWSSPDPVCSSMWHYWTFLKRIEIWLMPSSPKWHLHCALNRKTEEFLFLRLDSYFHVWQGKQNNSPTECSGRLKHYSHNWLVGYNVLTTACWHRIRKLVPLQMGLSFNITKLRLSSDCETHLRKKKQELAERRSSEENKWKFSLIPTLILSKMSRCGNSEARHSLQDKIRHTRKTGQKSINHCISVRIFLECNEARFFLPTLCMILVVFHLICIV